VQQLTQFELIQSVSLFPCDS